MAANKLDKTGSQINIRMAQSRVCLVCYRMLNVAHHWRRLQFEIKVQNIAHSPSICILHFYHQRAINFKAVIVTDYVGVQAEFG